MCVCFLEQETYPVVKIETFSLGCPYSLLWVIGPSPGGFTYAPAPEQYTGVPVIYVRY